MCIGFPMRVIEGDDMVALCERGGKVAHLSMLLIGEQPPGAWVLAHLGSAVRTLDEDEARLIDEALRGVVEAMEGGDFEPRFADLIGREPQLPEHLR